MTTESIVVISIIVAIPTIILVALLIVGAYHLFEGAGEKGWKIFIPLYNLYVMYEVIYGIGKGKYAFLLLVPGFNIYMFVKNIFNLAVAFGQHWAFGFGLLLLPFIFVPLLAGKKGAYGPLDFTFSFLPKDGGQKKSGEEEVKPEADIEE